MADHLDPLEQDIESFFNSGGDLPASLTPEPPVEPPAATPPAPAVPVAAPQPSPGAAGTPPAMPAEDPSILALRTQLGQLQGYSAQLERAIQEMQKAPPAPTVAPPDPETDPLGHMMHELAETKKMLAQLTERMSQQDQTTAQGQQLQNFVSEVQGMTTAFMAKQADYGQAYNYLRTVRTQDMRDLGVPENQIKEMLLKEELAVASSALKQGMNPAQLVYNIAKRYGYQTAAPVQPAQQMAALQKGVAAAPTQVDKGGAPVNISLDTVKDMSGDQLDKLVESNDLWHKVIGGSPEGDSIFH